MGNAPSGIPHPVSLSLGSMTFVAELPVQPSSEDKEQRAANQANGSV